MDDRATAPQHGFSSARSAPVDFAWQMGLGTELPIAAISSCTTRTEVSVHAPSLTPLFPPLSLSVCCSRARVGAAAAREQGSLRPVPDPVRRRVEDVQEAPGVVLDRRGARPRARPEGLQRTVGGRAALHQGMPSRIASRRLTRRKRAHHLRVHPAHCVVVLTHCLLCLCLPPSHQARARVLRRLRRHRPREPRRTIHHRGATAGGTMLLVRNTDGGDAGDSTRLLLPLECVC